MPLLQIMHMVWGNQRMPADRHQQPWKPKFLSLKAADIYLFDQPPVSPCSPLQACTHTHAHTYMHTCTYTHTHAHTHTHTHTELHILSLSVSLSHPHTPLVSFPVIPFVSSSLSFCLVLHSFNLFCFCCVCSRCILGTGLAVMQSTKCTSVCLKSSK